MVRCADDTFYIGITNNLRARLEKHNAGTGAKYTRGRRPVILVWSEKKKNATFARKREAELKSWSRQEKEKLLR